MENSRKEPRYMTLAPNEVAAIVLTHLRHEKKIGADLSASAVSFALTDNGAVCVIDLALKSSTLERIYGNEKGE